MLEARRSASVSGELSSLIVTSISPAWLYTDSISLPAEILTKAISKLKVFNAPQLKFSESQIKAVFQSIDSSKIEELDLGSCHEPQFSLVNQKTLISVSKNSYAPFRLLLLIKNLEMNIEELQKVKEENEKMEEEEKKLSAEEMSKQWERLACEVDWLRKQGEKKDLIYSRILELGKAYSNSLFNSMSDV